MVFKYISRMNMPPVVKTLLLLNVVVFIIDMLFPMISGGISLSGIFGLRYFLYPGFHFYQPLTYMFMHGGLMHLFFNMFALWMFGRVMEMVWGGQRFLFYYLFCGIGAALVQELGQFFGLISPYAMTIGASGAVYGILLAFGMTFPNERMFIIPIPIPIKAKYFVMFYAAVEVLEGMSLSDGVAHFAHLGGMLFGVILILYWRRGVYKHQFGNGGLGNNSSSYHEGGYDRGESLFDKLRKRLGGKKKPKMTVSHGAGKREKDYDYNSRKKEDNEEIDRILDKVRKDGYASLTTEEKNRLFNASRQ
ncbi:MAG: rhomboid family intramembrane serine protease [Bacteroides sp.]|nr:rhomboid family intramembrane serine protease [Roseburia sp.]MCM1346371.1 rhomboid family intramembrane serine protease [Bacteroides sp.]MCM1420406.1 rhomboid family intramembrane serine protease [Bacteroides sp.]